jgi:hypothetical protein
MTARARRHHRPVRHIQHDTTVSTRITTTPIAPTASIARRKKNGKTSTLTSVDLQSPSRRPARASHTGIAR